MVFPTGSAVPAPPTSGTGLGLGTTACLDIPRRRAVPRLLPRLRVIGPDDRRGTAALEYAVLAGLVSVALIGAIMHFSSAESSLFGTISLVVNRVASAVASSGTGTSTSTSGTGTTTGGSGGGDGDGFYFH